MSSYTFKIEVIPMIVTIIRHTRVGVPRGVCYGWSDVPLAESFEQEAALTKSRLEGMVFDHVFTSPLTRARRLADYCGYAEATVDDRLKECHMGEWEMQRYDDIQDPVLQQWYEDYMHVQPTGGESFPDLYRRVSAFLDELKQKKYHHVALFAHGGVALCGGIYAGLFTEKETADHLLGYGEMMEIEI